MCIKSLLWHCSNLLIDSNYKLSCLENVRYFSSVKYKIFAPNLHIYIQVKFTFSWRRPSQALGPNRHSLPINGALTGKIICYSQDRQLDYLCLVMFHGSVRLSVDDIFLQNMIDLKCNIVLWLKSYLQIQVKWYTWESVAQIKQQIYTGESPKLIEKCDNQVCFWTFSSRILRASKTKVGHLNLKTLGDATAGC